MLVICELISMMGNCEIVAGPITTCDAKSPVVGDTFAIMPLGRPHRSINGLI